MGTALGWRSQFFQADLFSSFVWKFQQYAFAPLLSNLYMRRFVLGWKKLGHEKRPEGRIVVQIHEKHKWFLREILKKKDGVEA